MKRDENEGGGFRLAHLPSGTVLRAILEAGTVEHPLTVETHGRCFHVEWDPQAPVTMMGQLVFFPQFLATGGLLSQ